MIQNIFKKRALRLGLLLGSIILILQLLIPQSVVWLKFDRELIYSGQLWRLLTGHWVHANWSHCLLNLAGLALVLGMFPALSIRKWAMLLVGAMAAASAGLLLITGVGWYVGFSGVLHGLFAGAAVIEVKTNKASGLGLLAILVGKLVYEQFSGALPGTAQMAGVQVVTDAHLWGAIGGTLIALAMLVAEKRSRT